jgi:hypothetical protein
MPYSVKLATVTGAPLLVVRRRATQPELSKVVPGEAASRNEAPSAPARHALDPIP